MKVADDPTTLDLVDRGPPHAHRRLSATALTEACLAQIAARNDELRAFITVTSDAALAAAHEADREFRAGHDRGPLQGIPISLKDLDRRGWRCRRRRPRGCTGIAPALADAVVTSRLKAAGAVLVGKTNLHEFALGTTSEDTAFGAVRNPHDVSRSAGGSSGGSAASVVAGMALATVGTDTGGSIRIPSAACGLVGFKPAFGEVPVRRRRAAEHDARSRRPAGAYRCGRGGDVSRAGRSAPRPPVVRRPSTLRLGRLRGFFEARLETAVKTGYEDGDRVIEKAGVAVTDVTCRTPLTSLRSTWASCWRKRARIMRRLSTNVPSCIRLPCASGSRWAATSSRRIIFARGGVRTSCVARSKAALADVDALVLPGMAIVAPPLGAETIAIDGVAEPVRALMLRLTQPFNVSGHPAIVLPCGRPVRFPSACSSSALGASRCSTLPPGSRRSSDEISGVARAWVSATRFQRPRHYCAWR